MVSSLPDGSFLFDLASEAMNLPGAIRLCVQGKVPIVAMQETSSCFYLPALLEVKSVLPRTVCQGRFGCVSREDENECHTPALSAVTDILSPHIVPNAAAASGRK